MDLPLWASVSVGAGIAAAAAYLTTPVAIAAAHRFAFYDVPAGYKAHARPTPYLGGAAVMLAFALAVMIGAGDPGRTVPLLGGIVVLLVVGTIDDRRTVAPGMRIVVELGVGAALSASGLGWKLGLGGALDAGVTAIWVAAVVNAFNLFDNMDGAASAMALVVAGGACMLALVTGDGWVAASSAALCGACLGFLPHNLASPARIFLGDGGSMALGFAAAALVAMAARSAEASSLALLVGLMLVGIPVLDTCLVIVSRRRRGVAVLSGGRDHLTHRTRTRIRTARGVAFLLGGAQAVVSALVIVASRHSAAALVYLGLGLTACAAATIAVLEGGLQATHDAGGTDSAATSESSERAHGVARSSGHFRPRMSRAGLVMLGLGAGTSPLFRGYYDPGVWVSIGLVMMVIATAVTIANPPGLPAPALLVLAALVGLGLWSLLSAAWAADAQQANTEANLWLSYAALFLLAVGLIRSRADATAVLAALGAGIGIVAASVLVRMLGTDPGAIFLGGRLSAPLGYVNGEGCVFAMGAWLGLTLAERRRPVSAGAGAATTVVLVSLTLLSQSRGAAIATVAATLVALLLIPGRRRRVLALGVVAAGVAGAAHAVTLVYSHGQTRLPAASVVHSAAIAILVAAVAAGIVWGLVAAATDRICRRAGPSAAHLRRGASIAVVLLVLAPIGVALVKLSTVDNTLSRQWHAFLHVSGATPSAARAAPDTRLFSGAGNRYDYWRVAWRAFLRDPVVGRGAGNFSGSYYRERRTTEAVQNPHSIVFQTLSELGLVGAALLTMLVAGIGLGAGRLAAAARTCPGARMTMVGVSGIAVVWLVSTSGDWMHLIPGVTAIALLAIAILCRGAAVEPASTDVPAPARRRLRLPAVAAIALVLAIGGANLLRADIVQRYIDDARAELPTNPAATIVDAGRALRLDSTDLDAYYLKAAGLARFNYAMSARATLLAAARTDPTSFVTLTLLGDLEVRAGDWQAAQSYYRRAHMLNPRDASLAASAANPRSAEPG